MRCPILFLVLASCATASCATSPATHSPLQDQLAAADTSKVEEVTRGCLTKTGWKVDPIGGLSAGGWNIVHAKKGKDETKESTDVYVQGPGSRPRITGGPDYDDPFWKCLSKDLAPLPPEKGAPLGAP
jgi:hypothetical protein